MSYNKRIETSREIRQWLYLIGSAGMAAYMFIPKVREKVDGFICRVMNGKKG